MIYYENRSLFIHIPRTSGVSICKAVMQQADPEATGLNVVLGYGLGRCWRHIQAHHLAGILKDWQILDKITVIRSPWRIMESTWRHIHQKRKQIFAGTTWATSQYRRFVEIACAKSFAEFVPWHFDYLRRGFFDHWCHSWETHDCLGVRAYRFEDMDRDWPEICATLLIPRDTQRPHENRSPPSPIEWTQAAIAFVKRRCPLDFDLFDYPREP